METSHGWDDFGMIPGYKKGKNFGMNPKTILTADLILRIGPKIFIENMYWLGSVNSDVFGEKYHECCQWESYGQWAHWWTLTS